MTTAREKEMLANINPTNKTACQKGQEERMTIFSELKHLKPYAQFIESIHTADLIMITIILVVYMYDKLNK